MFISGTIALMTLALPRMSCPWIWRRRGVDVVILAVDQLHLDVHHREAGDHARVRYRLDALLDARDVLLGHRAADDLRLELVALAGLVRFDDQRHGRELSGTAGLLLVGVAVLHAPRD